MVSVLPVNRLAYREGFPLRSRLSRFHDDLNMIAMIGTSDRLCWLAETCKILLLLLQSTNFALSIKAQTRTSQRHYQHGMIL